MIGQRKKKKFEDDAANAENARNRRDIAIADIKEQQAEIERLKKEKLQGSLVSIAEVEESFLEIGAKTKSQLARFISTLPPKLEGLTAAAMIEIIRGAVDEVLLSLAESFTLSEPAAEPEEAGFLLEETPLE
jgi:hypothetical protein